MTLTYTGQPANVNITVGGSDVSSGNALPVTNPGLPSALGSQSTANSVSVTQALSSTFATGQLAVTNTAQALGAASTHKNGIVVTNSNNSTASVWVGGASVTTSTGFEVAPGAVLSLPMQDLSLIYVIAAASSTSTVDFIAFD